MAPVDDDEFLNEVVEEVWEESAEEVADADLEVLEGEALTVVGPEVAVDSVAAVEELV